MTTSHASLAPIYQGWETYQQHLTSTIGRLSREQLALRAAPHVRSIGTLAAHILAVRIWWFHFVMNEGSCNLEPMRECDNDDPVRCTPAELVSMLEASWQVVRQCLNRWTPADLEQTFPTRQGRRSRQWILWHLYGHEFHHGGELFLMCNMHGLLVPRRVQPGE